MISIGTNFASSKPGIATGNPEILVGGENLIKLFLSGISRSGKGGNLYLASPFISSPEIVLIPAMRHLNHGKIQLSIYTGTDQNAIEGRKLIDHYRWDSTSLHQIEKLHAKMFLWQGRDRYGSALISSQNLTHAAFRQNAEAGVIISGYDTRQISEMLDHCVAHLCLLSTGSNKNKTTL